CSPRPPATSPADGRKGRQRTRPAAPTPCSRRHHAGPRHLPSAAVASSFRPPQPLAHTAPPTNSCRRTPRSFASLRMTRSVAGD
ncbi:MAG: hypothetical protein AVDCRST_MAG88-472, partial [uncultured Thermomicrobiales bacterium]